MINPELEPLWWDQWQRADSPGTSWLGVPTCKNPVDLYLLAECAARGKADQVIETGYWMGGSAAFFRSLGLDVVSVDVAPAAPGCRIVGSSVDPKIIAQVRNLRQGRGMVVLDSAHTYDHVRTELDAYSPMVSEGCHLVIEDTNDHRTGHHPGHPDIPNEAGRAASEFAEAWPSEWEPDPVCYRFGVTFSTWLRRRSP